MQFIKELVEEMAGPDDKGGPGPQDGTAPPPQGEHKDDGPNPTNGPEVTGPPTFQQLLASLKFLEDKVNHHHAEYNAKHGAGGAPGPHGGEKPGEHNDAPPTAPAPVPEPETKVFLKNKLEAETTTENAMETGYSKIWFG